MRRFWPLLLFVIILLAAKLLPQAKHSISINTEPQRIISLAPSITETAFAIGLGDHIVAVTDFCHYPAQALSLPKVGGYVDPNLEKIVSLHPDLVILLKTDGKVISQLSHLGIKTLTVDNTTLLGIQNSIIKIGEATNHLPQAKKLLQNMQQKINDITTKVKDKLRPRVLVSIAHYVDSQNLNKVYIAGQHDFYNDLIKLAGGQNVYQGTHIKVPSLSTEGLLKLNPDVIIDVFPESDNNVVNHQLVMQQWHSLPQINAVKHNRIYIVDQAYGSIPGPRVILLLQQMARMIHPEINWDNDHANH